MKRGEIIEWILILLAIGALWPMIVGYHNAWSRLILLGALVAMVWVFVRRLGRIRRR